MANRVDADDVKVIIDTSLTDAQITAFITSANQMISDGGLAAAGVSSDGLVQVEQYLAAHLLSLRDQRIEQERFADGTSFKYQGKTDMALDATHYGQMVKMFDTSGILANAHKLRPSMVALTEYDDDERD